MDSLCGLWVDEAGVAHLSVAQPDGSRVESTAEFQPFAWLGEATRDAQLPGITVERLEGEGVFPQLAHAGSLSAHRALLDRARAQGERIDVIRSLESQFLLQRRARLFGELMFSQLRRCQLDIETGSAEGGFSQASEAGDRILAIGMRCGGNSRVLVLEAPTDAAEKALLEEFNSVLAAEDPDTIEGHNLFKFDLDYLRVRCRRHKVPCAWGRFGRRATFRNSRLKVAERWIDFPRCDIPGRTVVDTYLLIQIYDITSRELLSYGLKDVALHLGITDEARDNRTYIEGSGIARAFETDRPRFLAYLIDDLRETKGVADLLLPTYFEQTKTFPILFQEATLRGNSGKIDLLFLEGYYHARRACPAPPEIAPFEGGYTRSFQEGVYRHVLHFDVASLYPSLLLQLGRNPRTDTLGVFIPLLTTLRTYRLKYKQLARTAATEELRAEYDARQASFKILINSFYGYLGFSGARFGDGELAAEVTRRGRELLQALIDEFSKHGCIILEADTDGIYLSAERFYDDPDVLLQLVAPILPAGIELEYDGRYPAMFCYKAKNYALTDGRRIMLKGSALRSRGIEPLLKRLTDQLIRHLLGLSAESPLVLLEEYRRRIRDRTLPVDELAKSETLSTNPDAYERWMADGGKPRRAAAEAALQLNPRPRMGDRISYYITTRSPGRITDWQRARPLSAYDPVRAPYDVDHYLEKLDDWVVRYGSYVGAKPEPPAQGELFSFE